MDEDLKDLIDTVELETKTRAQLEAQINSMKEEIKRLKFTIKEQQLLIEEQGDQISFAQSDLPSEINILKELITSQRKDLIKRDDNIERLNKKIDEITTQMEYAKDPSLEIQKNDLNEAQELILKLSQESEDYRNQIEILKNQVENLENEKATLNETNIAQTEENEEMVNIKRLNFQLMEQNGLLRVEIESLKSKLNNKIKEASSEELILANEKIKELSSELILLKTQIQEQAENESSEELEVANKKIEDLISQIQDYNAQLAFLQKELEKTSEVPVISTEEALEFAELREEYDKIKSELEQYQKENEELSELLLEKEESEIQLEEFQGESEKITEPATISTEDALRFAELEEDYQQLKSDLQEFQEKNEYLNSKIIELEKSQPYLTEKDTTTHSIAYDFPNHFQFSLFKRMYKLLDDSNKEIVINTLINDLNSNNNDIKINAIRILSEIKDKKVYETFLKLIHDEDWLTRYNLIKALRKFNFETEEFKDLLKKLTKDADVDVRELAVKMLNEISKL
ncbi:MAG: HEAT repeat domain-containing protein [Promethearchaeota archaeon]